MNPQNYLQNKACEQADSFSYTFTVQNAKYNLHSMCFNERYSYESKSTVNSFKTAALGHRPQPNNFVPPNYSLV